MNVLGIGKKMAADLSRRGYRNRDDLMSIIDQLPIAAQADLNYNPLRKIPREIIDQISPLFCGLPRNIIAGSYRRGRPFSADIDIVILRHGLGNDPEATLKSKLPLVFTYAKGPDKISSILKYKKIYVKVDFFLTNSVEWPFAVLYATGSPRFNIIMRKKAKGMGLLLNQRSLSNRDNGEKLNASSERQIFKLLDMRYHEPHERDI